MITILFFNQDQGKLMLIHADKNIYNMQKGSVTQKMAASLHKAFALDAPMSKRICYDQKSDSLKDALSKWLGSILIAPDYQLGKLLMPYVAQRFDEYLNKLKR